MACASIIYHLKSMYNQKKVGLPLLKQHPIDV